MVGSDTGTPACAQGWRIPCVPHRQKCLCHRPPAKASLVAEAQARLDRDHQCIADTLNSTLPLTTVRQCRTMIT